MVSLPCLKIASVLKDGRNLRVDTLSQQWHIFINEIFQGTS